MIDKVRKDRLTAIYNKANKITNKQRIPLFTETVFLAIEYAEKLCAESMQTDKDKLEARVTELEYIINSLKLPKNVNILFPAKD